MHMYSFYVSQSMLFVSFDLASSKPLKRYLICDFRVSILETFESPPYCWLSTCNLNIYTEEGARNTFAHGGGVGDFSGLQNRKYPFIRRKKSNTFTGHWSREQTVQGENKASEKSKSKPDQRSPKRIGNWPAKLRLTLLPRSSRSLF